VAILTAQQSHWKKGYQTGQTEPGLVAFYNIRPGNGVGLFFQPRSPVQGSEPAVCSFVGCQSYAGESNIGLYLNW